MPSKSNKFWIYAALIVLIVAVALAGIFAVPADSSRVIVEGIEFVSTDSGPLSHLPLIADEDEFIIAVQIHDPAASGEEVMLNGSLLFVVVSTFNGKQATHLIRVLDETNNLSYCLTNYADALTEETLTAEECSALLQSSGKAVVLIDLPKPGLESPRVTLSGKTIHIENSSFDSVGRASFTVLRAMFENADEALRESNKITALLG